MRNSRRKLGIGLILAAAIVPLSVVSIAYACGILATVHLNHGSAAPGATVSAIGGNYSSSSTASPVSLRFNSRYGSVLWTGRPDANGTIHATFSVPAVAAGYYLIDATQTTASGGSVAGTPGRAVIRIGNPAKARRAAAALWPGARPGPGAGTHAPGAGAQATGAATLPAGPAMSEEVLVALVSAVLLAGGVLVLVDDRRRGRWSSSAV